MSKHIGIVACSAEGAALCYRTICAESSIRMGEHQHPEITMHTYPLADYLVHIRAGDWDQVAEMMAASCDIVKAAGAEFAICPDNTIHEAMPILRERSSFPWLHIADAIAEDAKRIGYKKLGITGTKYLMTGPVYPETLKQHGIECEIPDEDDRQQIDDIIFNELVCGVFTVKARLYFNDVFLKLLDRGCEAVVMGCTEIPLLVDPDDCPVHVLDSTRLLARAAINFALVD